MVLRHVLLPVLLFFGLTASVSAFEVTGLYKAEAVVTGREEPERSRGFREGIEEVLGKLTAVSPFPAGPALQDALADPAPFVAAFEYEDRKKGIPIHDEQGTRDRSYILRMTLDRSRIDGLIAQMGLRKWQADRPRLAILLAIRDGRGGYLLTRDGESGFGQREVLISAAARRGVPIVMPSEVERVAGKLEPGVFALPAAEISRVARDLDGDGALAGELTLDPDGQGWSVRWMLHGLSAGGEWQMKGVSFDVALAAGIDRAARALAGAQTQKQP
ncbi:MAG: DUF2066 domain-containing protein [Pseudomonadota bacterium]|nr:DUF2066 domain-containing protein [Pseudomonadota bacterium]